MTTFEQPRDPSQLARFIVDVATGATKIPDDQGRRDIQRSPERRAITNGLPSDRVAVSGE